jgi:hypothetical protein
MNKKGRQEERGGKSTFREEDDGGESDPLCLFVYPCGE